LSAAEARLAAAGELADRAEVEHRRILATCACAVEAAVHEAVREVSDPRAGQLDRHQGVLRLGVELIPEVLEHAEAMVLDEGRRRPEVLRAAQARPICLPKLVGGRPGRAGHQGRVDILRVPGAEAGEVLMEIVGPGIEGAAPLGPEHNRQTWPATVIDQVR